MDISGIAGLTAEPNAEVGASNKDAPLHRAIERLGAVVPRPVLGGLHINMADSNFRHTDVVEGVKAVP
jgi:hypothetical protein